MKALKFSEELRQIFVRSRIRHFKKVLYSSPIFSPAQRLAYFSNGEIVERSVLIENRRGNFQCHKNLSRRRPARKSSWRNRLGMGKVIGRCNSYVSLTIAPYKFLFACRGMKIIIREPGYVGFTFSLNRGSKKIFA